MNKKVWLKLYFQFKHVIISVWYLVGLSTPWGQGVDSVSYPGPSIHPIMSLKNYILLYIYATYYGMN